MSIPAINRYTHGTHITVAHAMGTTIGINTMILLAGLYYILDLDGRWKGWGKKAGVFAFALSQVSLFVFWVSLIVAGWIKGTRMAASLSFSETMKQVDPILKWFQYTGFFVVIGLLFIVLQLMYSLLKYDQPFAQNNDENINIPVKE